jgi:hypothetical protein
MVTKKNKPENDGKDDVVIKRDPEIVKRETAALAKEKTGELAKRGTGGLAKKDTGRLAKKGTGELDERYTQLEYEYSFTKEETAWLVVFVLVILVPMVLPQQFLDDWEMPFLLFVVAPVMGWFIRLVYEDEKRQSKIR